MKTGNDPILDLVLYLKVIVVAVALGLIWGWLKHG
jgi:hypothetical protein